MKHDQYWQKPKNAQTTGIGAWWYASDGGIEVHADVESDQVHVTVRIPRRKLVEYLRRTERSSKT